MECLIIGLISLSSIWFFDLSDAQLSQTYPVGIHFLKYDDARYDVVLPATSVGRVYAVKFTTHEEGFLSLIKIADSRPLPSPGDQLRSFTIRVIGENGFTDLTPPMSVQIGDGVGVFKYIDMASREIKVEGNFYVVVERNSNVQDNGVCTDTSSNSGNSYSNIPTPTVSTRISGPGNYVGNIMIQTVVDTQTQKFNWGAPGSNDKPLLTDIDGIYPNGPRDISKWFVVHFDVNKVLRHSKWIMPLYEFLRELWKPKNIRLGHDW